MLCVGLAAPYDLREYLPQTPSVSGVRSPTLRCQRLRLLSVCWTTDRSLCSRAYCMNVRAGGILGLQPAQRFRGAAE